MSGDFRLEDRLSIVLVHPTSEEARAWLVANTDGTWWGGALAVEPRYVEGLAMGLEDAGLVPWTPSAPPRPPQKRVRARDRGVGRPRASKGRPGAAQKKATSRKKHT